MPLSQKLVNGSIIQFYQTKTGVLEVNISYSGETLWLSQKQITEIFEVDQSVVSRHIANIFRDSEVDKKTNMQKMHNAISDKPVMYYSLDVVLAVGYRTNSSKAIYFRKWANSILKDYLLEGYSLNQKLLKDKDKQIQQTLNVLIKGSKNLESVDLFVSLLEKYSQTLEFLNRYDEGRLTLKNNKQSIQIEVSEFRDLIAKTKQDLISKKEASEIFGKEVDSKFEGLVGNIYQTFDGGDLYPSLEEKAANLFYLIIKNHPFVDGNKRIASIILVYYLAKNNFLQDSKGGDKINQTGLVALALLIAQSNPNDKEILIKLITNFITDY
jgi:prophage maintenance system killer protein/predicted XRE-type DNA-binding protein